jgi:hypothetical protein
VARDQGPTRIEHQKAAVGCADRADDRGARGRFDPTASVLGHRLKIEPGGSATNILPVPSALDRMKPRGIRAGRSRARGLNSSEGVLELSRGPDVADATSFGLEMTRQTETTPMLESIFESTPADMTIHELITEAIDVEKKERRSEERHPLFRPLWLNMHGKQCPAFGREISEHGIGLLHDFELMAQEVQIFIRCKGNRVFQARTRIIWCHSLGQGWYISGGRFVDE